MCQSKFICEFFCSVYASQHYNLIILDLLLLFYTCVLQFNDQLISPKQFVHLAGKATLKDWKRAIRLGGVMLR